MSDLFISYSRSDNEPSPSGQDGFLNRLGKALEAEGLTVWFDKSDIHPTFDYQKEIEHGIEGANNFLFVISPASVGSPYCAAEVDRAVALNKRLIPLMRVKTPDTDVPTPFRNLDWIFARDEDKWDTMVNKIVTAVRSGDQNYVQTHTRLLARAREWNDSGRKPAFCLRGDDLTEGESWLARSVSLEPHPIAVQTEYIAASRQAAIARNRVIVSSLVVGMLIALVLAVFAVINARRADENRVIADHNAVLADNNAATAVRRADESGSLALIANAQMANSTDRLLALSLAVQANQINNPPPLSQRVLSEFAYTGGSLLGGVDVGIAAPDYVSKLLVSPDGTMLAAGTSSGAVSIWDTKTQTLKYKFEALKNSVWVLRFSPDSHRLLVGGGNIGEGIGIGAESGELSLWDMTTGHLIKQLEGHKQIVLSLAFSADNTLAVSSGFDGNLFVWDANTGAQLHAIVPQKIAGSIVGGTPSGVMFSADQTQIYVVPMFGKPVLVKYDRNSLTLIDSLQLSVPDACGRILMHPDGKRFLCAVGSSGLLYMLDVNTGVQLKQYPAIEKTLDNLSFNGDGTRLVTSDAGGGVWLWDVETAQRLISYNTNTSVTASAISPDGHRVYTTLNYSTVGIWDGDLANSAALYHLPLPINPTLANVSVTFSPDGSLLFASSPGDGIFLMDAATGSQITTYKPLGKNISTIAALPDGKSLLLGYEDGTLARWNMHTAETLWTANEHKLGINQTRLSKDARFAITGGLDGQVILWDTETGKVAHRFPTYPYDVSAVGLTPDGVRAGAIGCTVPSKDASSCAQHELHVWDVKSEATLRTLAVTGSVMAFSPDGQTVLVTDQNNALVLIDIASGKALQRMIGHEQPVTDMAYSPDGTTVLSASFDSHLILWDMRTFAAIRRYQASGAVPHLSFSPDGKSAASSSFPWNNSGKVELVRWQLDLTSDALLRWTNERRYVRNLTCAERVQYNVFPVCDANTTGNTAPTQTPYPTATFTPTLDTAKETSTPTRTPYPSLTPAPTTVDPFTSSLPLYRTDWSADGLHLVTTRADGTVQIWDAQSGKIVQQLTGFDAGNTAPRAKWSPDGSRIVASNAKNNAQVWDIRSGTLIATLTGHTVPISSLDWSKDGTKVLTGSQDATARIWDAKSGKELVKLVGHTNMLESVTWAPGDSRVATASDDGTARIWDAQTGKELFKLTGHKLSSKLESLNAPLEVYLATWSPDGTRLLTVSNDGNGIVWDTATGAQVYTLAFNPPDPDPLNRLIPFNGYWSHDGKHLVVFTIPGPPTIWDMQTGRLLFTLEGHTDVVGIGIWSADDSRLVTASLDGTLRVWDPATGKQIQMMDHHSSVWGAALSPDGSRVASSGGDGIMRIWDVSAGSELPFMAPPADPSKAKLVSQYEIGLTQAAKLITDQLATLIPNGAGPRTAHIGFNSGQFLPNGEEHWLYAGIAGETVSLEVQMQGTLTLRLLTLDGSELGNVTQSDTVHIENFKLPANGIYRIELSKGTPASKYSLTISSVRPETATPTATPTSSPTATTAS